MAERMAPIHDALQALWAPTRELEELADSASEYGFATVRVPIRVIHEVHSLVNCTRECAQQVLR